MEYIYLFLGALVGYFIAYVYIKNLGVNRKITTHKNRWIQRGFEQGQAKTIEDLKEIDIAAWLKIEELKVKVEREILKAEEAGGYYKTQRYQICYFLTPQYEMYKPYPKFRS